MLFCNPDRAAHCQYGWLFLFLFAFLAVRAVAQDEVLAGTPPSTAVNDGRKPDIARGEKVSEFDKAIWHVFQARNNDYWFGSHDLGAYRYDGKSLVKFTTKDGLASNQVTGFQQDPAGNIYIASGEGISKFNGQGFITLGVSTDSSPSDWKIYRDDLWFCGPPNTGVVYRYDGTWLHRLEFPRTNDGDEHYRQVPRSLYPNAKYSPYDVYKIFRDSQGNLWFATASLGVCRYDGKSHSWLPESELQNGSFGARSIVEDKDGKFWFCDTLHRYEVDLADPAAPRFNKEAGIRDPGDPNRTPVAGIMSCTLDSSGALWMATYGAGVWRFDGKDLTHYPVTDGDKAINLFSICQDNQGVLWLGTQNSGPFRFNGKSFEKFKM
jgi:ligand-binding sensor domain-containing protein